MTRIQWPVTLGPTTTTFQTLTTSHTSNTWFILLLRSELYSIIRVPGNTHLKINKLGRWKTEERECAFIKHSLGWFSSALVVWQSARLACTEKKHGGARARVKLSLNPRRFPSFPGPMKRMDSDSTNALKGCPVQCANDFQ